MKRFSDVLKKALASCAAPPGSGAAGPACQGAPGKTGSRCSPRTTATRTTFEAIVAAASSEQITSALDQVIASDSVLCSDHWNAYRLLASKKNRLHQRLNAHAGIRVIVRVFHIQNVNAYHSRLKNWQRRFHRVATKYLDNYLGWHRFRDAHPSAFASRLLSDQQRSMGI